MTKLQTSFQKSLVEALAAKHDVKITLRSSPGNASIHIEGAPVDTSLTQAEVLNIFRQVEHDDKDKTLAALYSKQVQIIFQRKKAFFLTNKKVTIIVKLDPVDTMGIRVICDWIYTFCFGLGGVMKNLSGSAITCAVIYVNLSFHCFSNHLDHSKKRLRVTSLIIYYVHSYELFFINLCM